MEAVERIQTDIKAYKLSCFTSNDGPDEWAQETTWKINGKRWEESILVRPGSKIFVGKYSKHVSSKIIYNVYDREREAIKIELNITEEQKLYIQKILYTFFLEEVSKKDWIPKFFVIKVLSIPFEVIELSLK